MIKGLLKSREAALFGILAALIILFAFTVDGFLNPYSLFDRSRHWIVPGLLAIPMTFVIATGGIDLSVGSALALCGIVLGLLFEDAGLNIWVCALAAVLAGLACGLFNGGVSSYLGIPPLVVTLATMTLFRGLAMGLSQARGIGDFPESFLWLAHGDAFTLDTAAWGLVLIPASLFFLFAAFFIGIVLLRRSWVGRYTVAIGENETAARFAAIPVKPVKLGLYAATGLMAGVAALFHTSQYAIAKADAAMGMELEAITCVVLGGTSIRGGMGSVLGTLFGLFILGILRYGLELAGFQSQWVVIIVGLLLIGTVVFNEWTLRRRTVSA